MRRAYRQSQKNPKFPGPADGPGKSFVRVERAYLRHLNPVGTSNHPLRLDDI